MTGHRVVYTIEDSPPIYAIRSIDLATPEPPNDAAARGWPSLYRDPRLYLGGWLTPERRDDWARMCGYVVVTE